VIVWFYFFVELLKWKYNFLLFKIFACCIRRVLLMWWSARLRFDSDKSQYMNCLYNGFCRKKLIEIEIILSWDINPNYRHLLFCMHSSIEFYLDTWFSQNILFDQSFIAVFSNLATMNDVKHSLCSLRKSFIATHFQH